MTRCVYRGGVHSERAEKAVIPTAAKNLRMFYANDRLHRAFLLPPNSSGLGGLSLTPDFSGFPSMQTICPRCRAVSKAPNRGYCRPCHNIMNRTCPSRKIRSAETKKRHNARCYLRIYVKRGLIQKGPCETCGCADVQGHHVDYNKPLEVRWLCRTHHLAEHGCIAHPLSNREISRT